jgi:Na+-driven multidrug efflux pump
MAVLILTLALSLFIAGAIWLTAGSRLHLSDDEDQNEWLNFAAYYLGTLPLSFVLIFFGIGGL